MRTCIRGIAVLIILASAGTASAQTDVVTNGSFETSASALTGWSTGPATTPGGTGTCGFNAAAAPGTETVTSTPGFAAAQGANIALASTATTGGSNYDCVFYQDVAIPAGATTATFSGSWGVKLVNGLAPNHGGVFAGIYATTKVPNYLDSTLVGTRQLSVPAASDAAFTTFTNASINVSSVAGTTVRLALHVVTDQTVGTVVAGFDNIQLMVTALTAQAITGFAPTSPVAVGTPPATLSATGGASGNPIVFATTSASTICTVSGSTVTFVGVGVCDLTANQVGNGSYSAAPQVTASITINAAATPQSIPTLSEWGLIILSSLLALGTLLVMRRRQI